MRKFDGTRRSFSVFLKNTLSYVSLIIRSLLKADYSLLAPIRLFKLKWKPHEIKSRFSYQDSIRFLRDNDKGRGRYGEENEDKDERAKGSLIGDTRPPISVVLRKLNLREIEKKSQDLRALVVRSRKKVGNSLIVIHMTS